mmetsp:Transcript_35402/g.92635  ORF Transcript_35402/g.92635 Transcript_35402/m.92635 type:complete len:288 (-) Transcript_35402:90-953(-)
MSAAGRGGERPLPKSVLKAQRLAAKNMKEAAASGFSPGTMRKAQVVGMGENSSLMVVEAAVRAVEGGVLSDLSQDEKLRSRVQRVRMNSTDAVFEQERTEKRLSDMGTRLSALRPRLSDDESMTSKLTQAEIKHSTLSAKVGVLLDEAEKEQLVTNLEEAQQIVEKLDGVGSRRNHILLHCLNGLANAKVATASGATERKEVLTQLFALLHEDQSLEVPHNNSQVRLNHCLKICERIVARAVDIDEVNELDRRIAAIEKIVPAADDGGAAAAAAPQPPPADGGEGNA